MARGRREVNDMTGWVGWVYFAGFMLTLVGIVNAIVGLVGLFKSEVYGVAESSLWILDFTTWGWAHLLLGVFLLLGGAAMLSGKLWGRVVGVVATGVSLVANFAFIPIYAQWALPLVGVSLLVLYALVVHGDEANEMLE